MRKTALVPLLTPGQCPTAIHDHDHPIWSLGPQATKVSPGQAISDYVRGNKKAAYDSFYDPTNGTVSSGAIIRFWGETAGMTIPQ